jgi:hypothetical protein
MLLLDRHDETRLESPKNHSWWEHKDDRNLPAHGSRDPHSPGGRVYSNLAALSAPLSAVR